MRIKTAKLTAPNKYIKTRGTIREKSPLDGGWMKKQKTSASNAIAKYQAIAKIRNLRNGREPQGGRLQNEMPNTVNQGTNKTQTTTQAVKCGKTRLYRNPCPSAPMKSPQLAMLDVPIIQKRLTTPIPQAREARRPGRHDCNTDAMAGFAVAHVHATSGSCPG
jgi:hypothetical protein